MAQDSKSGRNFGDAPSLSQADSVRMMSVSVRVNHLMSQNIKYILNCPLLREGKNLKDSAAFKIQQS